MPDPDVVVELVRKQRKRIAELEEARQADGRRIAELELEVSNKLGNLEAANNACKRRDQRIDELKANIKHWQQAWHDIDLYLATVRAER